MWSWLLFILIALIVLLVVRTSEMSARLSTFQKHIAKCMTRNDVLELLKE
jgi:uncharacterized protein YpmS